MWAVFVLGTYNLTDQLTLTVGARYTDEEKDFTKIDGLFLLSGIRNFCKPCVP